MTGKKDITIYDIAKQLGLSPATVSRGLKDHPAINIKTRKRIMDTAKEMGYRSNSFASNLRMQKTNTIGIIIHELRSQFISNVLTGIERVATEAGYDLIIGHSSETYRKEAANAHNLFHKRVDGLIASLAFDGYGPAILPATAVPGHLRERFAVVPLDGLPRRRVGIAQRRRGLPSAPVRAVIDILGLVVSDPLAMPEGIHPTGPGRS